MGIYLFKSSVLIDLTAEIRVDHALIALHLGRRPARDRAAEVEDVNVVGDAHDEVHVVLDEEHGQLQVVAQAADEAAKLFDLLVIQAACRLVQKEQAGLRRERASELDTLQRSERQAGGGSMRIVVEVDERESLLGALAGGPRQLEPSTACARADQDVLDHRHRRKQLDVLEGARDAAPDDPVGGRAKERLAVEEHVARIRLVEPSDDVEGRRLPCAVRADQSDDAPLVDVQRDVLERDDPGEAKPDVSQREQRHEWSKPKVKTAVISIERCLT